MVRHRPLANLFRASAVALVLVLPAAASGQAPSPAGPGPEFSVSAGVLAPLAELTSDPASFATEVSSAVGVTGTAGYWLGSGFGIAVHGSWAPARLNIQQTQFTGPIPDDLGDADYLVGTLDLLYRIRPGGPASIVEPFVGLGGGIRRLSVDPIASPEVEDATDPAATVTAGAHAHLWPGVALRLAVRDLVSRFESPLDGTTRVQNDIVVGVGMSFRP